MNKQTEALEQPACKHGVDDGCCKECYMEQTQTAQEPVAWLSTDSKANEIIKTHPAPSWQGLSDNEIDGLELKSLVGNPNDWDVEPKRFARAIEQALKEKNNAI